VVLSCVTPWELLVVVVVGGGGLCSRLNNPDLDLTRGFGSLIRHSQGDYVLVVYHDPSL
jgi:hypothetical protein